MPIYEYVCQKCRHKFSILVRGPRNGETPSCPRCQSPETRKVFSTFSVRGRTDRDVYENILEDPQLTRGMLADDPRALAEWNRRMSQGTDEETAPEYEEVLESMDRGEAPSPETLQGLKGEVPAGDDADEES
ncbi:MAG: zinc ribbon domain-containing protein [Chloroflexi bacterium]|nr:zinc ribbon domain-containing protein [Chloroflexota bacterium]